MKLNYKIFLIENYVGNGEMDISAKDIKVNFKDFDEFEEFLNDVELNDGYKIKISQNNSNNDTITIYRYKG